MSKRATHFTQGGVQLDARITKQRLGNMLSYDWLKILLAIGAAVAVLCILFTMIGTRPTTAQEYEIVAFGPLQNGEGNARFIEELGDVFSYEILSRGEEQINFDNSGTQVLMARRAAGVGTAVFAPDYARTEGAQTAFGYLCEFGLQGAGTENEKISSFLDMKTYFPACEKYVAQYFGENWETNEQIDMARVRADFLARNKKDKRFRYSSKKREAGILLEQKRLEALREDYLVVRKAFEEKILTVAYYTHVELDEEGVDHGTGIEHAVGINVGALDGMKKIYCYTDNDGNRVADEIKLLLFDNGEKTEYTRYETVSLLRHLIENYS